MGRHAVSERLDPRGQGLQAPDHAARGRGLQGGAQRPTHPGADGGTHRPVGDKPDDDAENHGTHRRLAVGGVEPLRHGHSPHAGTGGPDAADEKSEARSDPGPEEHHDRRHRAYALSGAS